MDALTAKTLQKVADFAGNGKLPISIGRVARLKESVQLIGDSEAGRVEGKAVIVVP
jgi:hypothetical protein